MRPFSEAFLARLEDGFERRRDPGRAAQMTAYMRDQFPFHGVTATERTLLFREAERGLASPAEDDLRDVAREGFRRPEREYQYAAVWLLRRRSRVLSSDSLDMVSGAITTKSWWDTVDELATHVVGDMVRANPSLVATMDEWSESSNIWLARTAILHQNRFKASTDARRLFAYCLRRAGEKEFFIRKAIGWALREYSKTDGAAVMGFLRENGAALSGLSKREAKKWLDASRR
jgi:3-methyladenine DNA glycosylase AlkD